MLVKNTVTLTTLPIDDPAALSTADRFVMHNSVNSEIEPFFISPEGVHGIWPLQ